MLYLYKSGKIMIKWPKRLAEHIHGNIIRFKNEYLLPKKMKKLFLMLFIFVFWFFILIKSSIAYINPGTGGIIIGSLWPLIVALFTALVAFLIKYFWKPIKKHLKRLLTRVVKTS